MRAIHRRPGFGIAGRAAAHAPAGPAGKFITCRELSSPRHKADSAGAEATRRPFQII
jgi:hypothetical protein